MSNAFSKDYKPQLTWKEDKRRPPKPTQAQQFLPLQKAMMVPAFMVRPSLENRK